MKKKTKTLFVSVAGVVVLMSSSCIRWPDQPEHERQKMMKESQNKDGAITPNAG